MKPNRKAMNGQKKLALVKETLRQLSVEQLRAAAGGAAPQEQGASNTNTTTRLCYE